MAVAYKEYSWFATALPKASVIEMPVKFLIVKPRPLVAEYGATDGIGDSSAARDHWSRLYSESVGRIPMPLHC